MVRICPMRDGPCPHGMDCPFVGEGHYGYPCKDGWQGISVAKTVTGAVLPEIGWPDSKGRIRGGDAANGQHTFIISGEVLVPRAAVSACQYHGWTVVSDKTPEDTVLVRRSDHVGRYLLCVEYVDSKPLPEHVAAALRVLQEHYDLRRSEIIHALEGLVRGV